MRRLMRDRKGATAIEYGLIASLLAVGLMYPLWTLADQINYNSARLSFTMFQAKTVASGTPCGKGQGGGVC